MNGYAFGGLIGNARGFAKYLQMLLRDSILISNKQKARLFEKQKIESGKPIDMCLSWFPGKLDKEVYYTHSGGGGAYYCELRIYPDKKIASVIMLNRTGVSDERILDKIDRYFLQGDNERNF
jgi:CubicO group peptidase (beta-lactamase class C family)